MLLSLADLATAVSQNPYPEATQEPKTLHFYFLETSPTNPDLAQLEALKTEREQFALIDTVFYLHAPDGIGRSKLAAKVEQALGVADDCPQLAHGEQVDGDGNGRIHITG